MKITCGNLKDITALFLSLKNNSQMNIWEELEQVV